MATAGYCGKCSKEKQERDAKEKAKRDQEEALKGEALFSAVQGVARHTSVEFLELLARAVDESLALAMHSADADSVALGQRFIDAPRQVVTNLYCWVIEELRIRFQDLSLDYYGVQQGSTSLVEWIVELVSRYLVGGCRW